MVWIDAPPMSSAALKADFTDPSNPSVTTIGLPVPVDPTNGGFAVDTEGDAFLGYGSSSGAQVELAGGGYDKVSIYRT